MARKNCCKNYFTCNSPVDKWDILAEPGNFWNSLFLDGFGSLGGPFSESAESTLVTLEHFEKLKMASKMAAVSGTWSEISS